MRIVWWSMFLIGTFMQGSDITIYDAALNLMVIVGASALSFGDGVKYGRRHKEE